MESTNCCEFDTGIICVLCKKMLPCSSTSSSTKLENKSRFKSLNPVLQCLGICKSKILSSMKLDVKVILCTECTATTSELLFHHKAWNNCKNSIYKFMNEFEENETKMLDYQASIKKMDPLSVDFLEGLIKQIMENCKTPCIPNPITSGTQIPYVGSDVKESRQEFDLKDPSSQSEQEDMVNSDVSKFDQEFNMKDPSSLSEQEYTNINAEIPSASAIKGSKHMKDNRNDSTEMILLTKRKFQSDSDEFGVIDHLKSFQHPVGGFQGEADQSYTGRKRVPKQLYTAKNEYKYKCLCNKEYCSKVWYERHLTSCSELVEEPDLNFDCDFCQISFAQNDLLSQHLISSHPYEYLRTTWNFENTQEQFEDAVQLAIDPDLNPETKDNTCHYCLEEFEDLVCLREHTLLKHGAIVIKWLRR